MYSNSLIKYVLRLPNIYIYIEILQYITHIIYIWKVLYDIDSVYYTYYIYEKCCMTLMHFICCYCYFVPLYCTILYCHCRWSVWEDNVKPGRANNNSHKMLLSTVIVHLVCYICLVPGIYTCLYGLRIQVILPLRDSHSHGNIIFQDKITIFQDKFYGRAASSSHTFI